METEAKQELPGVELNTPTLLTQARLEVKRLGGKMTTCPVLKNSWALQEPVEQLLFVPRRCSPHVPQYIGMAKLMPPFKSSHEKPGSLRCFLSRERLRAWACSPDLRKELLQHVVYAKFTQHFIFYHKLRLGSLSSHKTIYIRSLGVCF